MKYYYAARIETDDSATEIDGAQVVLAEDYDRLRDENGRMKVLLSDTQLFDFPPVPAWFAETVTLILEQEDRDD